MRKRIAAIGLAAATALTLCSCAGGEAKSATADGGTTEIEIWHYWDGKNADTFDEMVKTFNKENPDIKVKTTAVPNGDYLTKLRASASSNSLPDISVGDLIWVPQIAKMGKSADISQVLEKSYSVI